jgi:hypothetical protein
MKQAGEYSIGSSARTESKPKQKVLRVPLNGANDEIGKAINCFLDGKTGKFGKYVAVENGLVYRTILTDERQDEMKIAQNIIALRLGSGLLIGNASILPLIGRRVSFGNEGLNRSTAEVQTRLSQLIAMLPFTMFQETGLSLSNVKMIEQGIEETVTRKIPNPKHNEYGTKAQKEAPKFIEETVHFTGAKLFETDGVQFLFDVDRVELENKIFNPFLAKLPVLVQTIEQAYESLKPKEVIEAEAQGLKVRRQGEWFFIQSDETPDSPNATNKILPNNKRNEWERFTLQAGQNRPNHAAYGFKIGKTAFVSGKVEHSGREHAPIILKGWFKVIPNTAIQSFQITGDVD